MQLSKGLRKGEIMYLTTLKEEFIPSKVEIHLKIKELMDEFKDVMFKVAKETTSKT